MSFDLSFPRTYFLILSTYTAYIRILGGAPTDTQWDLQKQNVSLELAIYSSRPLPLVELYNTSIKLRDNSIVVID